MRFLKLTNNKAVRRLRWFVVCAICFDATLTLLGQPSTYWHDYQTALEGNPLFRQYLCRGYIPFCFAMLVFAMFVFSLISILPRRVALAFIFYYLFVEFFTTETWLFFRWHLGMTGLTIYAIIFAGAVIMLAFPKQIDDVA
jgi:hypothetical protein